MLKESATTQNDPNNYFSSRKLSEGESQERNSAWKDICRPYMLSVGRQVGEKEGGSPCRNSLPLFTVIRSTASDAIDSRHRIGMQSSTLSSNQRVLCIVPQVFVPFHFSAIRAKDTCAYLVQRQVVVFAAVAADERSRFPDSGKSEKQRIEMYFCVFEFATFLTRNNEIFILINY